MLCVSPCHAIQVAEYLQEMVKKVKMTCNKHKKQVKLQLDCHDYHFGFSDHTLQTSLQGYAN